MNLQHSPEFPDAITGCECPSDSEATAAVHRQRWRQALGLFVSPAMRLHRMRDIHTKMLHDALCNLDCSDERRNRP